GRSLSRIDGVARVEGVGGASFSVLSNLVKQLWPACHQRLISAMTLMNVNVGRYRRSDCSTLTIIVCRRAPTGVLLVRPVLRASAAPRSVRSASLLVPAAGLLSPLGCI